MKLTHTSRSSVVLLLALVLSVQHVLADKVLFIGDSWAKFAGEAESLKAECPGSIQVVNEGRNAWSAQMWLTKKTSPLSRVLTENLDAKAIWITLGGRDLFDTNCRNPASAVNAVRRLIERVANRIPTASILLTSYGIPKCKIQLAGTEGCTNEKYVEAATALEAIGNDFPTVTFVNTVFLFGGTSTSFSDEIYFRDGDCFHLNEVGYQLLWAQQAVTNVLCPRDRRRRRRRRRHLWVNSSASVLDPNNGEELDHNLLEDDPSRRRLLESRSASVFLDKNQSELRHNLLLRKCSSYTYSVFLYVEAGGHLFAIGHPSADALASGCPFCATHSITLDDGTLDKEVILWTDAKEGEAQFAEESSSLYIGSFQLQDLHRAFQEAHAHSVGSTKDSFYDIVTNNCAAYLMNLATQLGIKIDSRVTSFVAHRLLVDSAQLLGALIRESFHYASLFDRSLLRGITAAAEPSELTDKELVEMLVERNGAAAGLEQDP